MEAPVLGRAQTEAISKRMIEVRMIRPADLLTDLADSEAGGLQQPCRFLQAAPGQVLLEGHSELLFEERPEPRRTQSQFPGDRGQPNALREPPFEKLESFPDAGIFDTRQRPKRSLLQEEVER